MKKLKYVCNRTFDMKVEKFTDVCTECGFSCVAHNYPPPKPMKRIKKEVEKQKHIHKFVARKTQWSEVCECGLEHRTTSQVPSPKSVNVPIRDWEEKNKNKIAWFCGHTRGYVCECDKLKDFIRSLLALQRKSIIDQVKHECKEANDNMPTDNEFSICSSCYETVSQILSKLL